MRTHTYGSSIMPKNGSGNFDISDKGIRICGELKNGKVVKLDQLSENNASTNYRTVSHYYEKEAQRARSYIEDYLRYAEEGSLKLQNLTKVIMKKILAYLPK